MTRIGVLHALTFLVLIQCLAFCHSLPSNNRETVNTNSWWCEPCQLLHRKSRHSRQIKSTLKDQFVTTIHRYDTITQLYMDEIRQKLNTTEPLLPRPKWLPINRWLPRKIFFSKLKKGDVTMLPELHKNVQRYAATIQRLIDLEIHTQDNWIPLQSRLGNLTNVTNYLNILRCEIEEEIFEHGLEKKLVKLQKEQLDKEIKLPLKVDNLLGGLIKDFSVLSDYRNFLKKCRNKMFDKSRRNKRDRKNKKNRKLKKKTPENNGPVQS